MKSKKITALLLCAALTMASMTGCGSTQGQEAAGENAEAAEEAVAETAEDTAEEAVTETAEDTAEEAAEEAAEDTGAAEETTEAEGIPSVDETTAEANKSLYLQFDYGDEPVYCIGHKSPDSDTITSAIALSEFLNDLGIKAEPRATAETNDETASILELAGVEAPEVLTDASDCQLYLVDHSNLSQLVDGGENARIVGIVDHHGIGDVMNNEQINVLSAPSGAAVSLVYKMYRDCNLLPSYSTAYVMLGGILSDTNNFRGNVTALDQKAYNELLTILGDVDPEELFDKMCEAKYGYEGLSDKEIYYIDYKDYECVDVHYGIAVVDVAKPEEVQAMADRMLAVMKEELAATGNDFILCTTASSDYSIQKIGYVGTNQEYADKIMKAAFSELGTVEEGMITLPHSVSRKTTVVPNINEAIENN